MTPQYAEFIRLRRIHPDIDPYVVVPVERRLRVIAQKLDWLVDVEIDLDDWYVAIYEQEIERILRDHALFVPTSGFDHYDGPNCPGCIRMANWLPGRDTSVRR